MYSKKILSSIIIILLYLSISAFNHQDETPLPPNLAFKVDFELINNDQEIYIDFEVADKYYLYKDRIEVYYIDNQGNSNKADEISFSNNFVEKDDAFFGLQDVYRYTSNLTIPIKDDTVAISVKYQGCWDGGVCYPPETITFRLTEEFSNNNIQNLIDVYSSDNLSDSFFTDILNSSSVFALIIFFFAGLLLSFTPCVLPTYPITLAILTKGEVLSRLGKLYLVSIYILSTSLVFASIGIISAVLGVNLNLFLQNQWILISIALVMVLLALSSFGLYQLKIPNFININTTGSSLPKPIQAIILGVLSAAIIGPCISPAFVGIVLYISQTNDLIWGASILWIFALGMGVPLIFLALGLSSIRKLNQHTFLKKALNILTGFLLLYMALYIVSKITPFYFNWAALFILSICAFVIFIRIKNGYGESKIPKIIFVSLPILTLSSILWLNKDFILNYKLENTFSDEIVVNTLEKLNELLFQNTNEEVATVIYVTADWCVTCEIIKRTTLQEEEILTEITENISFIIADVTYNNDETAELMKNFNIFGPPTFLFFDTKGQLIKPLTIIGTPKRDTLLNSIRKIQQS